MRYNNLLVLGLVLILFSVAYATITSINLINPANNSWVTTSTPTFQFNATSDINTTFSCTLYINNTPYGTNTSVLNGTLTSIIANASLIDGSYPWYINCTDINGTTQSSIYIVGIDTIPPSIVISTPKNGSVINYSAVTINWTGSDSGSGIAYYEISNDSVTWTNVGTSTSVTYNYADGAHTFYVKAYDNAGNSNTTNVTFIVDTTPPSLVINSPIQSYNYSSGSITANWNGSDNASGIAYYNISIDGGAWIYVGTNTSYNLSLADGNHNFTVLAVDKAGWTTNKTVSFTVDSVPPKVAVTSPSNGTYFNVTTVTVNWTGSDTGTGINYYEISIDGGSWINVGLNTSYTFTSLADGTHKVEVDAVDYAGNVNASIVSFTVDTIPPKIIISSNAPNGTWVNYDVNISAIANDTNGATMYYCNSTTGFCTPNVSYTPGTNITISTEGTTYIVFKAVDPAGNSNESSYVIKLDKTVPTYTYSMLDSNSQTYSNNTWTRLNVTLQVNSTDTLSGIAGIYVDLNGSTVFYPNTTITLKYINQSIYNIKFWPQDNAGNNATPTYVVIKIDKTPPSLVITGPSNGAYINSSTVTISWTGSDDFSGINHYQVSNDSYSWVDVYFNTSVTYNYTDGTHTLYVLAADNAVNTNSTSVTFTVDTVPPTIGVYSNAPNNTWVNYDVNISSSANDTNGVTMYYCNSTTGFCTPNVSYTPGTNITISTEGTTYIVFKAVDPAGNSNESSYVIKLDKTPPTSTIKDILANGSVYTNGTWVNQSVTVQMNAVDALSGVKWIRYTVNGIPTLAVPNVSLPLNNNGVYNVSFYATDNAGNNNPVLSTVVKLDFIAPTIIPLPVNYSNPAITTGIFTSNATDALSGVSTVTLYLSDPSNTSYSTGIPMNYSTGVATATIQIGNFSDNYFGPGPHYMKVCGRDVAGNYKCVVSQIPSIIKVVEVNSLKAAFNSSGIVFNVLNVTTNAPVTTPEINPVDYYYTYTFSKNGFNVTLYNVTLNLSQVRNMTNTNLTLNLSSLINEVNSKISNVTNITSVWAGFPWLNATEYSYGEVVLNSTYNTVFYCTNASSCTQILKCNSNYVNLSNYRSVIPSNGACYLNINNVTHVFVDHFSGVVVAEDNVPPKVTLTCSSNEVYIGDTLTCTCNATDNVAVASIQYTKNPDTSIVGTFTTTCKATDTAGNVATANFTYTVKSRGSFGGVAPAPVSNVTAQFTLVWDKIVNETNMSFNAGDIAVNGIQIEVNKTFENVKISIQKLSSISFNKPNGEVYQYLKFDLTNINDSGIKEVTLYFKVSKSWMKSNGVTPNEIHLMRYVDGNWKALNTMQSSEDNEYVYYKAISPGLSYYAITAIKPTQNQTTNKTVTPINENVKNETKQVSNVTPITPKPQYNVIAFVFIALLIALALIWAGYSAKVNKAVKRRKRHK